MSIRPWRRKKATRHSKRRSRRYHVAMGMQVFDACIRHAAMVRVCKPKPIGCVPIATWYLRASSLTSSRSAQRPSPRTKGTTRRSIEVLHRAFTARVTRTMRRSTIRARAVRRAGRCRSHWRERLLTPGGLDDAQCCARDAAGGVSLPLKPLDGVKRVMRDPSAASKSGRTDATRIALRLDAEDLRRGTDERASFSPRAGRGRDEGAFRPGLRIAARPLTRIAFAIRPLPARGER